MRRALKIRRSVGILLLGGLALPGLAPAAGALLVQAAATPRFVYATGFQGSGYYANPGPGAAPNPAATIRTASPPRSAGGARTVGPGARNWTTGRRSPLHRPWLRAMN